MTIMREKDPKTPGVYIDEVPSGARPIRRVGTRTAGFVGAAPKADAPKNQAVAINNWSEFRSWFFTPGADDEPWTYLAHAVNGFFLNGGSRCYVVNVGGSDRDPEILRNAKVKIGLDVLAHVDEISIVAAPGNTSSGSYGHLYDHCTSKDTGDRVAILDGPNFGEDRLKIKSFLEQLGGGNPTGDPTEWEPPTKVNNGEITLYVPWIGVANPLKQAKNGNGSNQEDAKKHVWVPPSGHIAGLWARTDALRGVHKAPANEPLHGAEKLQYQILHSEQGKLNENHVNCIRQFREGILVWGARAYTTNANWEYLNVRRLFNMIEESISESTRWIVFEPNDQTLWSAIRRDVSAFLMGLWREGMLMGAGPEDAFYVKCDEETNRPESIREGKVVIEIGIAPVLPAEFVIFRVSQIEAGTEINVGGNK